MRDRIMEEGVHGKRCDWFKLICVAVFMRFCHPLKDESWPSNGSPGFDFFDTGFVLTKTNEVGGGAAGGWVMT